MYELLGISLVLATLLTINAFAALVAAGCWRVLSKPAQRWSARTRAEILLAMRIGPPAVALISVAAFLIPSYLVYEPYSTGEVVSKKLATLAIISAVGVAFALWRSFRSWLATRSLLKTWLEAGEPIALLHLDIPTFRIKHSFPIIAIIGTLRPRLFVAERVLNSLSEEEMIAAIAHERGHLAARDNFKRMLMRACRDMLAIVPCGRSIDRAWAENAEAAADEHAARRGSAVALNLASALIEIARMVPAGARPTMPVGAFILGDETCGVMGRVSRLVKMAMSEGNQSSPFSNYVLWTGRVLSLTLLAVIVALPINSNALASLHAAMERVVQILT